MKVLTIKEPCDTLIIEKLKKYDKRIKVNGKLGLWNYEKSIPQKEF